LAKHALDRAAGTAVDTADLLAVGDFASGVPTTAVRLMTYGLIVVGLWLGFESKEGRVMSGANAAA
jgi:hypothetical protein